MDLKQFRRVEASGGDTVWKQKNWLIKMVLHAAFKIYIYWIAVDIYGTHSLPGRGLSQVDADPGSVITVTARTPKKMVSRVYPALWVAQALMPGLPPAWDQATQAVHRVSALGHFAERGAQSSRLE